VIAFVLAACVHRGALPTPRADELDAILARASSRSLPAPGLKASFHIDVQLGDKGGSTVGGLVLHPPDDLRVEIQTPLHTTLLLATTDGTSIHAYVAKGNQYLRGDDAVATLEALAGDTVHPRELLELLAGIPPVDGLTLVSKEPIPGGVRASYDGPAGSTIRLDVDAASGALRAFEAHRGDALLFAATYGEPVKGAPYPKSLAVRSALLGLRLDFQRWEELGSVPDVFTLAPPPGSVERDLIEALNEL
jgi:hypothetical protein